MCMHVQLITYSTCTHLLSFFHSTTVAIITTINSTTNRMIINAVMNLLDDPFLLSEGDGEEGGGVPPEGT